MYLSFSHHFTGKLPPDAIVEVQHPPSELDSVTPSFGERADCYCHHSTVMELEDRVYTVYILSINPSVNYESSSEARGAEGMLSTPIQPHFRLVGLRAQMQDTPVRAALGFLIPVDLLAIRLVSAGKHPERRPDVSALPTSHESSARLLVPNRVVLQSPALRCRSVLSGGLFERPFAPFAKERCVLDLR